MLYFRREDHSKYYTFTYYPVKDGDKRQDEEWIFYKGLHGPLDEGVIEESVERPVKILMIAKGNLMAVYINDELISFIQDDSYSGDINEISIDLYDSTARATIDNIRFWNLDE